MIALLAMEPPADEAADSLRVEKVKVLRAMRPGDPARSVRGQYLGYLEEAGVEPDSQTETFVALELFIDSWRWSGVPFAIRAGKGMAETITEAVVEFRPPPTAMFGGVDKMAGSSILRFRMKPDNAITLTMQAKTPGDEMISAPVDLSVDYGEALGGAGPDPYERLIGDALAAIPGCLPTKMVSNRRGASSILCSTLVTRYCSTAGAAGGHPKPTPSAP